MKHTNCFMFLILLSFTIICFGLLIINGCGTEQIDIKSDTIYLDGNILPKKHHIICGDNICDFDYNEDYWCDKDCKRYQQTPKTHKFINPKARFDPGYIDPRPIKK